MRTDGKFFRRGDGHVHLRTVTYGPFPGGWPPCFSQDFSQIAAAGFGAIRIYDMPPENLLDAAAAHGLVVFGGLKWAHAMDFFRNPGLLTAAHVALAKGLKEGGNHPALAGIYVANEIPADLARWMGPVKTREAIEGLIADGKRLAPHLLFAYANYPSTEYLEPENADFTAFNIYLEDETAFRDYLQRLHHIAGDRPLVVSEFGLDSSRNGLEKQAEFLRWASQAALDRDTAGMTIFSWSDRWSNGGEEVLDWDFGLTDRAAHAKPALQAIQNLPINHQPSTINFFSVIVCTRNGRSRIARCLSAIAKLKGNFETIVVDDGSTDGTADFVEKEFPSVTLVRSEPMGLSAARNLGAATARGEVIAFTDDDCEPDHDWLVKLAALFHGKKFAAAGGPNLPPAAKTWEQAVVRAAPGAPSHVMLDDEEAEHLPGCNLAVTRAAFDAIGGFDPRFLTAGDDVDFCWRLRDAGFRLGFAPAAFVWHWRRPTIVGFLQQQAGYGRAEHLLLQKHPHRFSDQGDARWEGFVYGGGPVRVMQGSVIYHGPMGQAGYQEIVNRMLPLRGLDPAFDIPRARLALKLVTFLQPRVRAWERNRRIICNGEAPRVVAGEKSCDEFVIDSPDGKQRDHFLNLLMRRGWKPCGETEAWDLGVLNSRVQMATEHGDGKYKRVLVRASGISVRNLERLFVEKPKP